MAGAPVTDVYLAADPKEGLSSTPAFIGSSPQARAWVYVWAFLTWGMTIAFSILLLIAFTADVQDITNGPTYKRADLFPKSMGVWYKERWSDWSTLVSLYTTPTTAVAGDMASGAGSTKILDTVMKNLMCHGDVPTGTIPGPLPGGISTSPTGSDTVSAANFAYVSEMCHCVYQAHITYYTNASKTATTTDLISQIGKEFTTGEVGATPFNIPKGQDLLRRCFFSTRTSYKLSVDKTFFLAASPYQLIMHLNAAASIIAAMYLLSSSDHMWRQNNENAVMNWKGVFTLKSTMGAVFLGMLNLGLGLTCLIVSKTSDQAMGLWLGMDIALFLAMVALIYFTMTDFAHTKGSKSTMLWLKAKITHKDNILVIQRVGFWIQYLVSAPALVLLYDSMTHQRASSYLLGRSIFVIGLAGLAAGTDMFTLFYEKISAKLAKDGDMQNFASLTNDNLRYIFEMDVRSTSTAFHLRPPYNAGHVCGGHGVHGWRLLGCLFTLLGRLLRSPMGSWTRFRVVRCLSL